ncbi:MAG: hypothetical protein WC882_03720 [Candidatus Gracilibacteria bacterium]
MLGHVTKHVVDQIAVRVEHAHAFSGLNVSGDEQFKQFTFSGAAFSDNIQMAAAVYALDPKA